MIKHCFSSKIWPHFGVGGSFKETVMRDQQILTDNGHCFVPNKSIVWNVWQCLGNLLIKISEDAAYLSQVMILFVIGEHLLDNSCEILPELLC